MEKTRSVALTEVGKLLAGCRRNAKLTQRAVATQLKLSRSAVSRIERGKCDSEIFLLKDFAKACGATLVLKIVPA